MTAKDFYLKFWDMPEEDIEGEDIKQFECMEQYAVEFAKFLETKDPLPFNKSYLTEMYNQFTLSQK